MGCIQSKKTSRTKRKNLFLEGMGQTLSKKTLGTRNLHENLIRPFPPVAAIPIIEDFLLANNPDQIVAMICKTNNSTEKISAQTEPKALPCISKDNEGKGVVSQNSALAVLDLQSGSLLKEEKEESENHKPTEENSGRHKPTEEDLEEHKATEEDKPEIIYTWELMEGLEDEETYHNSENAIDHSDMPRVSGTSGRSSSLDCFHTVKEYEAFLARKNSSLWDSNTIDNSDMPRALRTAAKEYGAFLDRNKRYLWDGTSNWYHYYLGKHLESVIESTSRSLFGSSSLPPPPKSKHITPVSIHWEEDSKAGDDCALISGVLQIAYKQSETGNEVKNQQNNNIAEVVIENINRQEKNHTVDVNVENGNLRETNLENNQLKEKISGKNRLHERGKSSELGRIIIPPSPDFSAFGSLREWLNGGSHPYSPGVSSTPSFGSYGLEKQWSKTKDTSHVVEFAIDGAEIEMHPSSVPEGEKQAADSIDSVICSDTTFSDIERENWDFPVFDPELLESFEKALEQLSEDEKCVLRQIDENSFC